MAFEISLSNENLAAVTTAIRRVAVAMETHVFIEVAGVTERPMAHLALQRLVSGMGAKMDRQAVSARVQFSAEVAAMTEAFWLGKRKIIFGLHISRFILFFR